MPSIKHYVHRLLEPAESGDLPSKSVDLFLIGLILANCLMAVLETLPAAGRFSGQFAWFEAVSVGIFTVEYLLRLWSCVATGRSPFRGRLKYALHPMMLIDLLAILPFYLIFLGVDLRTARIFRLLRFFRIAKLSRYSRAMRMLGRAMVSRKEHLVMAFLLGAFALVVSATLMYYAEHAAQPEMFSSIPASFWWAVTTLTTVGYGDAYPVTTLGRVIGGFSQVIGVGLLALPMGILASAFLEDPGEGGEKAVTGVCPHCGKDIGTQD